MLAGIPIGIFARKKNVTLDDKRHQSFPLRLSPSLRQQAVEFAHSEGISLNHFIGIAVAEKVSRMESVLESNDAEKTQDKGLLLIPAPKESE